MRILKLLLILSFAFLFAEEAPALPLMEMELMPSCKSPPSDSCSAFSIGQSEERQDNLTLVADAPKKKEDLPHEAKKEEAASSKDKECKPAEEVHKASHEVHKATESYETAFIKTIVVLVGLLVLVILTVWMFRKISHGRFRGMNVLKSVKILEKRPLSPKSMLYLIEVGGKQVLIAESQLEVRNVATLDWLGSDKDL